MAVKYPVWLLFVILFLPALAFAEGEWGCCIPPSAQCFDGSDFSSESDFQSACGALTDSTGSALIQGAGQFATCTSFGQCTMGCCCAGSDVLNSPIINSDETRLQKTQYACSLDDAFVFRSRPAGTTCVDICGGSNPGPGPGNENLTFTVSGVVFNGSSDNPLKGAEAFIPFPGGEITDTTDENGEFTLVLVPPINTRVFVVHPSCQPGQSSPFTVDRNIDDVEATITCALESCEHRAPTWVQSPTSIRGTSSVEMTVQVEDFCTDFVQFEPARCDEQFQNCVAISPTESPVITDAGLPPETTFCYKVAARYQNGEVMSTGDASQGCITTGHVECMQDTGAPEWCGMAGEPEQQAVLRCDEQNQLDPTICEPGLSCTERGGLPSCVPTPPCELCNGLVGLFSSILGSQTIEDGLFTVACNSACNLDSQFVSKPLMVDAYSSCVTVSDCSDYHSQSSCSTNTCGMESCSWNIVNKELGQGICTSEESPPCAQCDDLFGYCSRDMCMSISDSCYYDQEGNGLSEIQGCISAEEAACRYYDTQQDCLGSGPDATYNIHYLGEERSSGDNARTRDSADVLGIGACSWNPTGFCYKNADEQGDDEDCRDRMQVDPTCVRDVTPPTTTFFLSEPPIYSRLALRTLPYSVIDDTTPVSELRTFICFEGNGETCAYPTETFSTLTLPDEGTYTLKYYSIDANKNSEVVQTAEIMIKETSEPGVEEIDIEEDR